MVWGMSRVNSAPPIPEKKIIFPGIFLLIFLPTIRLETQNLSEHIGFSRLPLWTKAGRGHPDGDMVVDGFAHLFAYPTAYTPCGLNHKSLLVEIHR